MALGFIALALAVSGFLLPSLYIIVFWVMAAPGVQLVWVTNHGLKALVDRTRVAGGVVVYGLASGLGNPLVWLSFLAILTFWLSHHLGGMYLLGQAINWSYSWHGLTISFSHVMAVVLLFFLFKYLIFITHSILARLRDWSRLDQGVVPSLQTISSYLLWTVFIYIVLVLFGLNPTTLLVIAGGMSVGIGFGLQNIVNNFISGLIILFGRPLHHGDVVELDNRVGRVVKINIRSTVIQTFDNAIVFVPNSDIISKNLVNWSKNDRKVRRDILVGVAYGTDAAEAEKVLRETSQNHPHVLASPQPQVLFTEFADSSIVFTLRVWVNNYANALSAQSDLRKKIYTDLANAGIEIAFPQMDLHIKDTPERKSKESAAFST